MLIFRKKKQQITILFIVIEPGLMSAAVRLRFFFKFISYTDYHM